MTGRRFGRLVVIALDHIGADRKSYWLCACECGESRVVRDRHLLSTPGTVSCGCYRADHTVRAAAAAKISAQARKSRAQRAGRSGGRSRSPAKLRAAKANRKRALAAWSPRLYGEGVSRQKRYQRRRRAKGRCSQCGDYAAVKLLRSGEWRWQSLCERHRAARRKKMS